MNRPYQIGVTGGIGSGKSLVCKIFIQLGVPVYDADSRAKELMNSDPILIDGVMKQFGKDSIDPTGRIDRTFLARKVFKDREKLDTLNELVHPRVFADYQQWVTQNKEVRYLIKEAALLFEAGSWKGLDEIIVVAAPEELRMKRVLGRDVHRNEADVRAIMSNQMPEEEKRARADVVIDNDETRLIIPQVLALHLRFLRV